MRLGTIQIVGSKCLQTSPSNGVKYCYDMHLEQTKKKTTTDAWFYRSKQIIVRRNIPLRWNPEQPSHDGGSLLEAFQTCGRSLLTSELKRLFIVADISQSGMCGEEGRYPAVYVPIPKVASLPPPGWLTSIDCFSRPQRRVSPSRGVVAASPRGKCRLLRGACRQNHRFHLVAAGASCKHDAEDVMSTDAEFQVTLYFGVI